MTLLDVDTLLTFDELRKRCRAAVLKSAQAMLFEDPATANHDRRKVWASQAGQQLDWVVTRVFQLLVVDAIVGPAGIAATDEQITTAVTAIATNLALVGMT